MKTTVEKGQMVLDFTDEERLDETWSWTPFSYSWKNFSFDEEKHPSYLVVEEVEILKSKF